MNRLVAVIGLIAIVCVVALWVSQCSGPRPVVEGEPVVFAPDQPGQPYRVEATILNTGPGHGEVEVTFNLRDATTGRQYQQIEHAQLEPGRAVRLAVEIPAAPGTYVPSVQVEYPPG
jgi:hypothetical protein